jgi:hypothetical protein
MDELEKLRERFTIAIERYFTPMLIAIGYSQCGIVFLDIEERRDTALRTRFIRDHIAIEVGLLCVGLTVRVTRSEFLTQAKCDSHQRPVRAVSLEQIPWASTQDSPPLRWMRHSTLEEEAIASFTRFARNMNAHFDEAFAYLADRAKSTPGFL